MNKYMAKMQHVNSPHVTYPIIWPLGKILFPPYEALHIAQHKSFCCCCCRVITNSKVLFLRFCCCLLLLEVLMYVWHIITDIIISHFKQCFCISQLPAISERKSEFCIISLQMKISDLHLISCNLIGWDLSQLVCEWNDLPLFWP